MSIFISPICCSKPLCAEYSHLIFLKVISMICNKIKLNFVILLFSSFLTYHTVMILFNFTQGVSSKGSSNEVEIIRYQVLIPVTEVQVRASSAKDMDSHFLWELIHLRSQLQRRSEKVYVLSNRYV